MKKIIGYFLLCVTIGLLLYYVVFYTLSSISYIEFLEYLPIILSGVWITFVIPGVSYTLGLIVSFLLVFISYSNSTLSKALDVFQKIVRYIPILAILYLVYYGSGEISSFLEKINLWWFFQTPLLCALFVFTINTTAYQSYILNGCLKSVSSRQKEAGAVLGMTPHQIFVRIVFPQGVRFAIKPLGQEFISLVKISCIANVITVFDLLGAVKTIYSETFNISYLLVAALIYIVVVELSRISVEKIYKFYRIPS